jgi:alcohol dehydrogenase class IV
MTYEYGGTLHRTARDALAHACEDYIYGGMAQPYAETLAAKPEDLAAECIRDGWISAARMAEWGVTEADICAAVQAAHAGALARLVEEG